MRRWRRGCRWTGEGREEAVKDDEVVLDEEEREVLLEVLARESLRLDGSASRRLSSSSGESSVGRPRSMQDTPATYCCRMRLAPGRGDEASCEARESMEKPASAYRH
jgi:hypothetical protein